MQCPMLAVAAPKDIKYPVLASAKLDGVRCVVENGVPLSRTGKPIPNLFVQQWFSQHPECEGLDGELIVGPPNLQSTYRTSSSGLMSRDGTPNFCYYVFDHVKAPTAPYVARYAGVCKVTFTERVQVLQQMEIASEAQLRTYEEKVLSLGYEGLILRNPQGQYKFGRSTAREGLLLKVKRFVDGEAKIIGVEELMHNENEAKTDNFGHTERSSHQENLVPAGVLGALVVEEMKTGVRFSIGTGFSADERADLWSHRKSLIGRIAKYKSFPVGVKDLPRFPTWLGLRDPIDM